MANLKSNGTELARLRRVLPADSECEFDTEQIVSVRSNGWLLKKSRLVDAGMRGWSPWTRWMQFKPYGARTSTLTQQVRWMIEHRNFQLESGSLAEVNEGWQVLCLKVMGESNGNAVKIARRARADYEIRHQAAELALDAPVGGDGWADWRRQ